jgi:phosphoglycolate phosphatase-like HAD superfamily hydrolase
MNAYARVVFDLDGHSGRFQPRHSRSTQPGPHGSRRARTHRRTGRAAPRGRCASACRGNHPGLRHTADDAIVEEVIPACLDPYRRHPVIDSVLFEGVAETLHILSERGLPLGVCTKKKEQIAHQVLKGIDISQLFTSVVGGDRLTTSKRHPQHLRATFEESGQDPDKGVFVGDSTIDQLCTQATGIDIHTVAWAPSEVTDCWLSPIRQLAILTGVQSATSPITTCRSTHDIPNDRNS